MNGFLSVALLSFLLISVAPITANAADNEETADESLLSMSLEDLLETEVVSVSKKVESAFKTSASLTVIRDEDIRRSGAVSVVDVLRQVPGLQVNQISASAWSVSTRGYDGQFANKLLVMIDGRSVYSPLFSGTYWDTQDLPLEIIDRIEVIRGSGATVWGANAVNGVINIITKKAEYTQGTQLTAGIGNHVQGLGSAYYGGKLAEDAYYRVHAKYFDVNSFKVANTSTDAEDDWRYGQAGFRMDWSTGKSSSATVQGLFYNSTQGDFSTVSGYNADGEASGVALNATWDKVISDVSDISIKGYIDNNMRSDDSVDQEITNINLEFVHSYTASERQSFTWGGGYRLTYDDYTNKTILISPLRDYNQLYSFFAQDKIELVPEELYLTLGTKFEHNTFSGYELQPSAHLSWTPNTDYTFWGAISRSVRTPNRAETGIRLLASELPAGSFGPGTPPTDIFLVGRPRLDAENMLSYELGMRGRVRSNVVMDASLYLNEYKDVLGTYSGVPGFDPVTGHLVLPLYAQNNSQAVVYGGELSVNWHPLDNWRLMLGYSLSKFDVETVGTQLEADTLNADHKFVLNSYYNPVSNVELDASVIYHNNLRGAGVDAFVTTDVRAGWFVSDNIELSVVGRNLFDDKHQEFPQGGLTLPSDMGRTVFAKAVLGF